MQPNRRIVAFDHVTADGYFAAHDGNLGWVVQYRLVDEYQFVVSPVLLGGGRSLMSGLPDRLRLELLEARTYPSGNVMLRYAPD